MVRRATGLPGYTLIAPGSADYSKVVYSFKKGIGAEGLAVFEFS